MKRILNVLIGSLLLDPAAWADEYLGNYSANKHSPNSTSNPNGAGSPYKRDSPTNPYGEGLEIYGQ
jgi:hypothetical protein